VVDDERCIRDLMARVLADEGYRVTVARDVPAAIAVLDRHQFDAILTDLRMPGPPGLVLVEEIERRGLQTPVMLMSGSLVELDDSDPRVERLAGIVGKPPRLQTLRSLISGVVGTSP
jgi:CheY-like chemotaxis protein